MNRKTLDLLITVLGLLLLGTGIFLLKSFSAPETAGGRKTG